MDSKVSVLTSKLAFGNEEDEENKKSIECMRLLGKDTA